jgi:CHAT domain-containing protein/tetratricopeptide (TPR) repeat protein
MMRSLTLIVCYLLTFPVLAQSDYTAIQQLMDAGDIPTAEQRILLLSDQDSGDYHQLYGDILLKKGDNQRALESFETAQKLYEQNNASTAELAKCYSQLGITHWAMGNHNESLKFHGQALKIHESTKNTKGIAASHNDIGLTYSNIDPDKALEYYKKALTAYEKIYDAGDERLATSHINIGIISAKMDFQGDAFDHFDLAVAVLEEHYGKDHPTQAFVYSSIGNVHFQLADYESARKYQEMALTIYKKAYGNKHPEIANTYNALGNIYGKESKALAALQQYQEAICANIPNFSSKTIYSHTPIKDYYNPDLLLISLQLKAQALESLHYEKTLKKRDLVAAWNNFISCDSLIDDIRRLKTNEADKIALGEKANEIYEDGIRTSEALSEVSWNKQIYNEKAFYFAEKSKSSVLLDAIADANAKSFANIPDHVVAEEQQLKTDIAYYKQLLAKSPKQSDHDRLFTLESQYLAFIKSLEKNYPQYYDLKYNVTIPTIASVREMLHENEAILSYFIASKTNRLYTFYISKKKFKIINAPILEDFDRYISGYRNSIYYNVQNTYRSTASILHAALIPAIEKHVTSLTIIPAGRLGVIPFEALLTSEVDDETENYDQLPYLLNSYDVNTQYAAALLTKGHELSSASSGSACILAPVTFSIHGLPELPATASEAMNLNNLFTKNGIISKSYTYSDANEINIKSSEIANSQYLHFATHGVVDEKKPELSQIFLASNSATEDGNLYTGEIYNLQLNADLVTLSACQTGLGKIYKGEGIVGLSRALLYAGANNMLVSLWSVADQSTASLMVSFYEKALDKYSYSEGLQMAKKEMIQQKTYAAPYYWAPFILIGQ